MKEGNSKKVIAIIAAVAVVAVIGVAAWGLSSGSGPAGAPADGSVHAVESSPAVSSKDASDPVEKTSSEPKKPETSEDVEASDKADEEAQDASDETARAEEQPAVEETWYVEEDGGTADSGAGAGAAAAASNASNNGSKQDSGSSKKPASENQGQTASEQEKPQKETPAAEPEPEKKMVWVEPVYEEHVVHPDTGTRYCGGANNGSEYGTCTESWHGTKDETYELWHAHWKAYVQRRTAEEAEEGRAYVCDHVHDDSKWVPDPDYTEQVLVQEGYWKEED